MTTFSKHKNLAVGSVATAPSPATSGTSITLGSGDGALMPTTPFYATMVPQSSSPTMANAEIVRVTNIAGDVLTIVRSQGGTTAKAVTTGWLMFASITSDWADEIEAAINNMSGRASGIIYGADRLIGDSQDFGGGVGGWTAPDGGTLTTDDANNWIPYNSTGKVLVFTPDAVTQGIEVVVPGTFLEGVKYAIFLLLNPGSSATTDVPSATVSISTHSADFPASTYGISADVLMPLALIWQPEGGDVTDPVLRIELSDDTDIRIYWANVMEILGGLPHIGRFDAAAASPSRDWSALDTAKGVGLSLGGAESNANLVSQINDVSLISSLHQLAPRAADFTGALIVKHIPYDPGDFSGFPWGLVIQNDAGDEKLAFVPEAFPDDGLIQNGSVFMLYDDAAGAAKLKFRGKDSAGAIVGGNLSGALYAQRQGNTASSASEVNLWTYSLPANTLGTNKGIRITLLARRSIGSGNATWRPKFNGTNMAPLGAAGSPTKFEIYIFADGATNAQRYEIYQWSATTNGHTMGATTHDSTGILPITFDVLLSTGTDTLTMDWASVELLS